MCSALWRSRMIGLNLFGNTFACINKTNTMKIIKIIPLIGLFLMAVACGTAEKQARLAEKKKKEKEKMEQLESDKKSFEQKNKTDLGK